MSRFMSDAEIAEQYKGFNVTFFSIEPLRHSEGWSGTIEIEFPNADDVDFDISKVENFFVYDRKGERIAFDNWYPREVEYQLLELIRSEIKKRI